MDKRLRNFMSCAFLLIIVLGLCAVLFTYVLRFFTINVYNNILTVLIVLSLTIMAAVVLTMLSVFTSVKRKQVKPMMFLPVKLGLKLVMPFALFVTELLKQDKDMIRSLFIDINNLFVQSGGIRKDPDRIMLLLPHCLQNSECTCRVTGNIHNCRRCGCCCIGDILDMVEETGVKAVIVTGGTAARNAIAREKPEIVLSVACERDLAGGISDVNRIPVLGLLNQRPNGPCVNTTVDVGILKEKLYGIMSGRKYPAKAGIADRN